MPDSNPPQDSTPPDPTPLDPTPTGPTHPTEDPQPASRDRGWLARFALHRPELRAWAAFDWAHSAMMLVIVTAVFPIYFRRVAAAELPPEIRTRWFLAATTLSLLSVALVLPLLGALADYRRLKKKLFTVFLAFGVAGSGGLFFVEEGDWILALVCFGLANAGAIGTFVFYDSLLPHVARPDEIDRLSTSGYALGYLGSGLLLLAILAWIKNPEFYGLPPGTLPTRLAFLVVAAWWLVFSLPLLFRVSEPPAGKRPDDVGNNPLTIPFKLTVSTIRELKRYPQALLMLVAYLAYNDGVLTFVRMSTIYGDEIGLEAQHLILAILLVQFVGVPCTALLGLLATRIGARPTILITIAVYTGVTILARFMETELHFYILAGLIGLVQGGCQALSRSLFASLIPRHRSGEFFAFFGLFERFANILGPGLLLLIHSMTDSIRTAIPVLLLFFGAGGFLLTFVKVEQGQREAAAEDQGAGGE